MDFVLVAPYLLVKGRDGFFKMIFLSFAVEGEYMCVEGTGKVNNNKIDLVQYYVPNIPHFWGSQ